MYLTVKSPNYTYLYNANSNKIIQISQDAYKTIEAGSLDSSLSEINELKKAGFFDTNTVDELKHSETDNIEYQLKNNMTQLILQVTQNCNLRCSYCPYSCSKTVQRSHSNKAMTFDVAKKSIDLLAQNSHGVKEPTISFYGGEPLLNLKLIEQCVTYAKEVFWGKNIQFSMTSNGTLWTEQVIDFFVENDFQITLSLDGPEKIHDKHRLFTNGNGSFKKIMKYLRKAILKHGEKLYSKLSINMVMDPQNDFDEISALFEDEYLNKIHLMADVIDDDLNDQENIYDESFTSKLTYNIFLALLNYFSILKITEISKISESVPQLMEQEYESFLKTYNGLPIQSAPSGPCIAGQRRLFVDVLGRFFPCERISETSEFMNIGNIEDGLDYNNIKVMINIAQLTADECKNCYAFRMCDHCIKMCDENSQLSREKKLKNCSKTLDNVYYKVETAIFVSELYKVYLKGRQVREEYSILSM